MKRVVQAYKPPGAWTRPSPPGIGDFVRGVCHAYEMTRELGLELRVDVSQTGFDGLIAFDEAMFQRGDPTLIAAAAEVENTAELRRRLVEFRDSDEQVFYVCTNIGAWDRPSLPAETSAYAAKFFAFTPDIRAANLRAFGTASYAVLSVRCGDRYFSRKRSWTRRRRRNAVCDVIEARVLPTARHPIIVMSDSLSMKRYLAKRYGMLMIDEPAQHGAHGGASSVARDLDLIKHSSFNYHINAWMPWWSGFSHYTSLIFGIPELNVAGPFAEPRRGWLRIIYRAIVPSWLRGGPAKAE